MHQTWSQHITLSNLQVSSRKDWSHQTSTSNSWRTTKTPSRMALLKTALPISWPQVSATATPLPHSDIAPHPGVTASLNPQTHPAPPISCHHSCSSRDQGALSHLTHLLQPPQQWRHKMWWRHIISSPWRHRTWAHCSNSSSNKGTKITRNKNQLILTWQS